MQIDLDRIDGLFPTIYVTLISVLLGLALEDLLSLLRTVDINDPWVWIVGVSLLSFYVAVWTGYAFLAITQKRRPRLLDTINVFFVSVGLRLLNDSVTRPHAYFFFAVSMYYTASMFAVWYNLGMLRKILPYETSFADYRWSILTLVPHVVGFPIIGLLSVQGMLSTVSQMMFGATALVSSIAWAWTFYNMWTRLLDRANNAALHGTAAK